RMRRGMSLFYNSTLRRRITRPSMRVGRLILSISLPTLTFAHTHALRPDLPAAAGCGLRAARQLERGDPGAPVEGAAGAQVLVGVPERAVVARIDLHAAVVPPAVRVGRLRAAPRLDYQLGLHRAERVGRHAAGDADRREHTGAGRAIAQGDVAQPVHRDAAHPTAGFVRREGALLEQRHIAIG